MSIYYTDKIELKTVSYDGNGVETGSTVELPCRIEDTNRTMQGPDGSNITAKSLVFFSIDQEVKQGDQIRILEIRGTTYRDTARKFQIIEAMSNQGFSVGEWEVYI